MALSLTDLKRKIKITHSKKGNKAHLLSVDREQFLYKNFNNRNLK